MQISYWILWGTQRNTKCVTDFFTNMMYFLAVVDPNKMNLRERERERERERSKIFYEKIGICM